MSLLPLPPPIANNEPEIFNRLFKDGSILTIIIINGKEEKITVMMMMIHQMILL